MSGLRRLYCINVRVSRKQLSKTDTAAKSLSKRKFCVPNFSISIFKPVFDHDCSFSEISDIDFAIGKLIGN